MPKTPTVKKIIDSNPSVDPEKLRQFRKALSELRKSGVVRKGYGLASPINRRRATVARGKTDSRTIYLGNRR
jgi:hypothetical protein